MGVVEAFGRPLGLTCIFLDYRPKNSKNRLAEVRRRLVEGGAISRDEDVLVYDRFNPDDFEHRLSERLRSVGAVQVIVDVSTMSKLAILLTLGVCARLGLRVRVIYSEAKEYGPAEHEFARARERDEIHQPSLQIFDGVRGVVRVESLGSVAMQGQPTAALIFMSFNDALTQVLLNTVYPSRLFLINGRPPEHSWREAATAWIHEQVRREWETDNPVMRDALGETRLPRRCVSTLDYRETVDVVIGLYWELSASHRVLLAPAGSKMQAVGCWIAKQLHRDMHIEYPSPYGFLERYSSGISRQWSVDFGALGALLKKAAAKERREYLQL